jgi:DNA polymerase-3 subunit gamma/tau
MAYLVSARKYRPQLFEELVGQEHIAGTIRNAVAKGRVGHAYLFSGPRGIGKTSAARIFAKAMNCENGPTPAPCGRCVFCREITEGRALDLVEIDGASNRRIDEVRQLRENVRFVPSSAKYKIYIVDEVHMLTTEAFNALLKTLEEPPEHVIFIFATTEVNKVPHTIRSRCQQFVFKRIPIPRIIEVLKRIGVDLGVKVDEKALFWISRSAQGSMRDAESILDQMISYCGGNPIGERDVFTVLGLPGYEVYHRFGAAVAKEDSRSCLAHLDGLLAEGFEVNTLLAGLIEYYRNLYVLAVSGQSPAQASSLVELPPEEIEKVRSLLGDYSPRDVQNILTILSKTYLDTRNSDLARELLEIALIKMARYREIVSPVSLVRRMEELKREIDEGGGGESAPRGPAPGGGEPRGPREPSPEGGEPRGPREPSSERDPHSAHAPEIRAAPDRKTPGRGLFDSGMSEPATGPAPKPEPGGSPPNGNDLAGRVVSHISRNRRALAEFLSRAKSCTLENNLLTFAFDEKDKLGFEHVSEESARRYIETVSRELLQPDLRVRFVLDRSGSGKGGQSAVSPDVSKVIEVFKGEIVPNNDSGGN